MTHKLCPPYASAVLLLAVCLSALAPPARAQQQQQKKKQAQPPQARQVTSSILIRWEGRPGVNRYRLQLATDEKFADIVYDQAVEGRQHLVEGLPPGNYFWRVAAAAAETASFSKPERVTLGDKPGDVKVADVLMPSDVGGWRTATGEVVKLVPAQLRTGAVVDFVGVGADGRVFAVDGASGISLWTARFRPDARRGEETPQRPTQFAPLVLRPRPDEAHIIIATEGGVRALRGDTGRELWRAKLEGRAAAGAVGDVNGDGSSELVVVTQEPERFYLLEGTSGRVLAEQRLEAEIVGAPHPVATTTFRGVALALKNGRVEIRGADGAVVTSEKMQSDTTTSPMAVARGTNVFMVVGTERGLTALSLPDLKLLGTIVAEDDRVQGTLNSVDLDGDGSTEIVMLTRRGRVALVSTADGNVKWYAEGVSDAASVTFADVNSDGVLDVIAPGGSDFALGFSGRDGSLVMKIEEGAGGGVNVKSGGSPRSLVVAPSLGGGAMLVGGDPARVGLRAVELPKGSVRTAAK